MKFIEIADGVSVNIESIEFIERTETGTTKVMVRGEPYETPIPYAQFKTLLVRQIGTSDIAKNIEQLAKFQTAPTP